MVRNVRHICRVQKEANPALCRGAATIPPAVSEVAVPQVDFV